MFIEKKIPSELFAESQQHSTPWILQEVPVINRSLLICISIWAWDPQDSPVCWSCCSCSLSDFPNTTSAVSYPFYHVQTNWSFWNGNTLFVLCYNQSRTDRSDLHCTLETLHFIVFCSAFFCCPFAQLFILAFPTSRTLAFSPGLPDRCWFISISPDIIIFISNLPWCVWSSARPFGSSIAFDLLKFRTSLQTNRNSTPAKFNRYKSFDSLPPFSFVNAEDEVWLTWWSTCTC